MRGSEDVTFLRSQEPLPLSGRHAWSNEVKRSVELQLISESRSIEAESVTNVVVTRFRVERLVRVVYYQTAVKSTSVKVVAEIYKRAYNIFPISVSAWIDVYIKISPAFGGFRNIYLIYDTVAGVLLVFIFCAAHIPVFSHRMRVINGYVNFTFSTCEVSYEIIVLVSIAACCCIVEEDVSFFCIKVECVCFSRALTERERTRAVGICCLVVSIAFPQ